MELFCKQKKQVLTRLFLCSRTHTTILDPAKPELSLPPFTPRPELPLHVGGQAVRLSGGNARDELFPVSAAVNNTHIDRYLSDCCCVGLVPSPGRTTDTHPELQHESARFYFTPAACTLDKDSGPRGWLAISLGLTYVLTTD